MAWVIESVALPKIWITESRGLTPYDITFQLTRAERFLCQEDAKHEMLRLGLGGQWFAQEHRGLA